MTLSIERNNSLQPHNTMAVDAKAHALTRVSSNAEINQALDYAQANDLNVLVLGEGSNTIFGGDYSGLVILNRLKGITVLEQGHDQVLVHVASGENWHEFVEYSINQGWFGLENLALIPGLVGAAPMQNIGAYGVEVKDSIHCVEYIDIDSRDSVSLSKNECEFDYRESRFKQKLAGKVIITGVTFKLSTLANVNLRYPALGDLFDKAPTPKDVFSAVCNVRLAKLPLPKKIPNTGSFFKNPIVNRVQHEQLKLQYIDLVSYPFGDRHKLAAGWLIDHAGWKNKSKKGVKVHDNQALVLTNPEKRSGFDVLSFAAEIQMDIRQKFSVELEIEPRIYP